MSKWLASLAALLLAMSGFHATVAGQPAAQRPVHTYSIVARDPDSGQLGVAVQSHWFAVGTLVPWDGDEKRIGKVEIRVLQV